MHFLNTCGSLVRNADMHVGFSQGMGYFSTASTRQSHDGHFTFMGRFYRGQYVG